MKADARPHLHGIENLGVTLGPWLEQRAQVASQPPFCPWTPHFWLAFSEVHVHPFLSALNLICKHPPPPFSPPCNSPIPSMSLQDRCQETLSW